MNSNEIPNITVQLLKAFDVDGNYTITFVNGEQTKLPVDQIIKYLTIYRDAKPLNREQIQNKAIKSKADFVEVIA